MCTLSVPIYKNFNKLVNESLRLIEFDCADIFYVSKFQPLLMQLLGELAPSQSQQ